MGASQLFHLHRQKQKKIVKTDRAMSTKPHEDVACSGVQPSLSRALISASCSIRNFTILKLSSIHAYITPALSVTHNI